MKISFLLTGLTQHPSGGPFMLYKFMDTLSKRGHEVYAVTRTSRVKWEPDFLDSFIGNQPSVSRKSTLKENLRSYTKKLLSFTLGERRTQEVLGSIRSKAYHMVLWKRTIGLLDNWIPSDVTIATHWTTAHAAYFLMDKTIPMYYIQMYEELFGGNELEQKQARLTYFMPLVLMAGSYKLKEQIKTKIQKDAYILQPGIPAINCLEQGQKLDLKQKFQPAKRIKVLSFAKENPAFGFPEMIEAMRIAFSELGRENIEWNIFGNNPDMKLPGDIPINYVKGRGNQLIPLFLDSHIALHNPWYSGFPGGTLESMSAGIAVVATSVNAEGVYQDGQNCLVVPSKNIKALADAIIRLIRDRNLAMKLAEGGLKTASEFTWDKATDNLEKIIGEAKNSYPYKGKFADIPLLLQGDKEAINKTLTM